ncbi:hypothetical protein [Devosia sp. A449]
MFAEQSETQTAIAASVIADIAKPRDGQWGDRQWRRIVVNFEAQWSAEDLVTSVLSFAVAGGVGVELEKVSVQLSQATEDLFARLAAQMQAQNGVFWTVCDLVVDSSGRFTFDFSYDPPYRLSGNLNDKRFADYVERHRTELNAK